MIGGSKPQPPDLPPASAPSREAIGGWVLLVGSLGLAFVAMLVGPSAGEPPLPGHAPLLRLDTHPPAALVTGLLAAAVVAGAVAVWLGLTGRWRPGPRRLLAVGLIATAAYAVAPPVGSADPLSYAAYGRMAATGHNPWTTTPASQAVAGDPVSRAVEAPWRSTPSVYGPLAAGEQEVASRATGTNIAANVELLDVIGAAAVAAAGLLLWFGLRDDARRRRAMLAWTANPLVLIPAVAGGHVDTLVASLAVAALTAALVAGRVIGGWLLAGIAAGLALDIKAPALLIVVGLLVAAAVAGRRRSRRAASSWSGAALLGAAVVVVPAYAVAGSAAIHQLRRASQLVSAATPWRPIVDLLQFGLARHPARTLLGVIVLIIFAALVVALARLVLTGKGTVGSAAAFSGVLVVAYLLATPYLLPWYDALAWAAVALLAAGVLDSLLIVQTAVLALAYLPGRAAVTLHGGLRVATETMRAGIAPAVGFGLLGYVALLALRYHQRTRVDLPGSVGARRVLPASTVTKNPRQERGTQPRP